MTPRKCCHQGRESGFFSPGDRAIERIAAALERLRGSGVIECWIDTAKGRDVAAPQGVSPLPTASVPRPASVTASTVPSASVPMSAQPARGLRDEVVQAASVCQKARGAVLTMFAEARLGKALDAEHCMPLVDDIAARCTATPVRW